jgi:hypothetical protein
MVFCASAIVFSKRSLSTFTSGIVECGNDSPQLASGRWHPGPKRRFATRKEVPRQLKGPRRRPLLLFSVDSRLGETT